MRKYSMPLGRTIGFKHYHPERTASRSGPRWDSDIIFQVWPNRESMARSIRMQERAGKRDAWRAVVPLSPGEGF